jgi:hypothetical protein
MRIRYERGSNGRRELIVSDESDRELFPLVADALVGKFHGKIVTRLNGLDQIYWDIEIDDKVLILFLEHYLGISLYSDDPEADELLARVGKYLETFEPNKFSKLAYSLRQNLSR